MYYIPKVLCIQLPLINKMIIDLKMKYFLIKVIHKS